MNESGEVEGSGRGRQVVRLREVERVVRLYIFENFPKTFDCGEGRNRSSRFQTDLE